MSSPHPSEPHPGNRRSPRLRRRRVAAWRPEVTVTIAAAAAATDNACTKEPGLIGARHADVEDDRLDQVVGLNPAPDAEEEQCQPCAGVARLEHDQEQRRRDQRCRDDGKRQVDGRLQRRGRRQHRQQPLGHDQRRGRQGNPDQTYESSRPPFCQPLPRVPAPISRARARRPVRCRTPAARAAACPARTGAIGCRGRPKPFSSYRCVPAAL